MITCNGTIAWEYPYQGIPAINGSTITHYSFKFNYNPKSIGELKKIILNLKKKKPKIDREKILEIYFLRHIYYADGWLFENTDELIKYCKGWQNILINPRAYEFFLKNSESIYSKNRLSALKKFVESKDYIFNFKHLGRGLSEHISLQTKKYLNRLIN